MIFFKYNDTVIIDYDWRNLFMMILISNHKKVCWRDDIKSIKIFIYLIIIKPVSTSSYSYPGAGCGLRSLVVWTFTFSCSRQAARPGHRLVSSGFRPWNGDQHLTGRLKLACLCSLWTIQEFLGTQWFFCYFGSLSWLCCKSRRQWPLDCLGPKTIGDHARSQSGLHTSKYWQRPSSSKLTKSTEQSDLVITQSQTLSRYLDACENKWDTLKI